jgi:hypothetical protein
VLLVDGFEREERDVGVTVGRDHDREASAGADIEDARYAMQMGDDVLAVFEVLEQLVTRGGG